MKKMFLLLAALLLSQFVIAQGRQSLSEWKAVKDTTSCVNLEGIILIRDYISVYSDLKGEKYSFSKSKGAVVKTRYYYILNGKLYGNTAKERRRLKADYQRFIGSVPVIRVIPRKEALAYKRIYIEPDAPGIIVVTFD